jgi:hypothetical protein
MRWISIVRVTLALSAALTLVGCGSSGFDSDGGESALTMQFLGFDDEDIEQQDTVFTTGASVDVCPTICEFGEEGIFGDETFEQFTETIANAEFMNMGASNILLDSYTVNIQNSGIPPRTGEIAAILPGGTCSNSPTTQCGFDSDCGVLAQCEHVEVPVTVLLFDFVTKELVRGDRRCPGVDPNNGLPIPGDVVPQTFQTTITFSGSDMSGKRFTIKTGLVAGFFDANNCEDSGGGQG